MTEKKQHVNVQYKNQNHHTFLYVFSSFQVHSHQKTCKNSLKVTEEEKILLTPQPQYLVLNEQFPG